MSFYPGYFKHVKNKVISPEIKHIGGGMLRITFADTQSSVLTFTFVEVCGSPGPVFLWTSILNLTSVNLFIVNKCILSKFTVWNYLSCSLCLSEHQLGWDRILYIRVINTTVASPKSSRDLWIASVQQASGGHKFYEIFYMFW